MMFAQKIFQNILVLISLRSFSAMHSRLSFTITSKDSSMIGVRCAIQKSDYARGISLNNQTNECLDLQDSWFSTQTLLSHHNYVLLKTFEQFFQPTSYYTWDLPSQFWIDSSVSVYIDTKTLANSFAFRFLLQTSPEFVLASIGLRYGRHVVSYNSMKSNIWGHEKELPTDRFESNTQYKIKLLMTGSHYHVHVDDDFVGSFARRYLEEMPVYFQIESLVGVCHRVQYTFDV